jgi:hypothetical protein
MSTSSDAPIFISIPSNGVPIEPTLLSSGRLAQATQASVMPVALQDLIPAAQNAYGQFLRKRCTARNEESQCSADTVTPFREDEAIGERVFCR